MARRTKATTKAPDAEQAPESPAPAAASTDDVGLSELQAKRDAQAARGYAGPEED